MHAQNLKIGKPNNLKVFGNNVFKQKQTNKKLKQKRNTKNNKQTKNKNKKQKNKRQSIQTKTNEQKYLQQQKTNNQTKEEAKDERWRSKLGKVHLHSISEFRCESDVVLYSYINRRNGD